MSVLYSLCVWIIQTAESYFAEIIYTSIHKKRRNYFNERHIEVLYWAKQDFLVNSLPDVTSYDTALAAHRQKLCLKLKPRCPANGKKDSSELNYSVRFKGHRKAGHVVISFPKSIIAGSVVTLCNETALYKIRITAKPILIWLMNMQVIYNE
jgi:hypothetical protein